MKRLFAFLTCIVMLTALTACEDASAHTSPVLKVVLQSEESDSADYEYRNIYGDGTSAETEIFVPDDTTSYTAAPGAIQSQVVDGQVVNTLETATLIDSDGNQIEADDRIAEIMQAAADTIDHSIWQFEIILDEDLYFAFIKLSLSEISIGEQKIYIFTDNYA